MDDSTLESLRTEAATIAAVEQKPMRQAIPIRIVENLQLAPVTPESISRTLQVHTLRAGFITSLEWFLLDGDESTAIYATKCHYGLCNDTGDLLASTRIDRHGMAELPFTNPGSLCCDLCDQAITDRYEQESEKLANPRKRNMATAAIRA